ncbi:hypothetical protein BDV59DRAFT_104435 [Aspergillus ambiguus]|uniref:uncharacterized protein n=1 Tax=Aspergillus ambiguus TaxID=176160 RepID=UPI003CCD64F3
MANIKAPSPQTVHRSPPTNNRPTMSHRQPPRSDTVSAASKRKHSEGDGRESTTTPRKRAQRQRTSQTNVVPASAEVIDLSGESPVTTSVTTPVKKQKTRKGEEWRDPTPERRERRFRSHPPKSFLERLHRARTQRMYVVGHTVTDAEGIPKITFDIVGTTGNIYKTTIGKVPVCDCPDGLKGNQCKHICYVLVNVLKAPEHLQYQLAFLSSELREFLDNASLNREEDPRADGNDGKRKEIDGDCPICFMEFEPDKEEIVWCRAACGNNIHKTCFQQWAATQQTQGVRCVFCRSPWESDNSDLSLEQLMQIGQVNADGYVNVASQVGLSGQRGMRPSLLFYISSVLGLPTILQLWLA